MSDRLKELQRQRTLAQEQLAWLDREIAREGGSPAPSVPVSQAAATIRPSADAASAEAEAEELLAQYKTDPHSIQSSVKRGCYLYFVAALVLVGLATLAFYFLSTRR